MFKNQIEYIRNTLRKNDALYVLIKCLKNVRNPEFCDLIRSYFIGSHEGCIYFLEHPGEIWPEKYIYDISVGEKGKSSVGFCAEIHHLLYRLMFADEYNLLPRVVWGKGSPYFDNEMNTNNAFEYYFEPISEASRFSSYEFKNLIRSDVKHILKYKDMVNGSYSPDANNIKILSESYKKYIHLNLNTQIYIREGITNALKYNKRILGIHARGGDFKQDNKNHPHHVSAEEYLEKAKQEFASLKYEKIFVATDDELILKKFIECFSDNLIFYDDVPRVSNNQGLHLSTSNRPMHQYRLGLELLRDVYTLVSCDSLICGLSHVSFMVRYVKESLGEQFDKVIILDEGINK